MIDYKQYIPAASYLRDPFAFAQEELLGAYLCSNIGKRFCAGKITELEVYLGHCDKACHAYPDKKTKRTEVMFRQGGCRGKRDKAVFLNQVRQLQQSVFIGAVTVNGQTYRRRLRALHMCQAFRRQRHDTAGVYGHGKNDQLVGGKTTALFVFRKGGQIQLLCGQGQSGSQNFYCSMRAAARAEKNGCNG